MKTAKKSNHAFAFGFVACEFERGFYGFCSGIGKENAFLEMTGRIQELCAEGNENRIRRAAVDAGMISLKHQASSLALAGAISISEAYRFGYSGEAL